MSLPKPEWLTVGSLARQWDTEDEHIEQLIETGKLQAEIKEGNGLTGSDPNAMIEWERCNRLIPHPSKSFLPGGLSWPLGSKVIIRLSEVERIEKSSGLPRQEIKKIVKKCRDDNKSDDQIVYELREAGYQNNEIGVALGLGIYRKGSNGLAIKVSRLYNNYKKVRGLTSLI